MQEVFTVAARQEFQTQLSSAGYTVIIPHDADVCWLPSGLVTAFRTADFALISSCFEPYLNYFHEETFANKGFFRLHLWDKQSRRRLHLINTHTQSDTVVAWLGARRVAKAIRAKQAEQILAATEHLADPVLVVGDLNQETPLHGHLRFLQPPSEHPIRKATFFGTGEDLDHIAWLPLQWAPVGCGFCGIRGPRLSAARVHAIPLSDHAPVEVLVDIPQR